MTDHSETISTSSAPLRRRLFQRPPTLAATTIAFFETLSASRNYRRYLLSALWVTVVVLTMVVVRNSLDILDIGLLFLLSVLVLALVAGSGPAAFAAILSFLAFNFFFIEPLHTFSVEDLTHVLALFVFLGVAIVTGQLVARVRSRTEEIDRERRRTELLYELNAALIGGVNLEAILATIARRTVEVYGAGGSRILLPNADGILTVRASYPDDAHSFVDRHDRALADWVMENREPAGSRSRRSKLRWPHGAANRKPPVVQRERIDVLYVPIATTHRSIGVLEVTREPGTGEFGPEDRDLLFAFANQAALALERTRLTETEMRATALAQSEELKTALLAAVSHDLRTPLATIKTSVTSLIDQSVDWKPEDRSEFLSAIDEEADRLARLVDNLLDLSRIEGGALRPYRDWHSVPDLLEDVVTRLSLIAGERRISTHFMGDFLMAYFDYDEISRVLVNLSENALKYSPADAPIELSARIVSDTVEFSVHNGGRGVDPGFLPLMFQKFTRDDPSGRIRGSGLGLAICKGLVEAHGGSIWVESDETQGTTVRFTLPINAGVDGTR